MNEFDKIRSMNLSELEPGTDPDETAGNQPEGKDPKNDVKHKMADPVGQHYYVNAHITDQELIPFVFRHTYQQPVTLICTIIGIIWPIYNLIHHKQVMFSIVCLFIFLIFYPFSVYMQGKSSNKRNKVYDGEYHYMVDEAGLHLEVRGDAVDIEWQQVIKVITMKKVIVLYTGDSNAFLMPTAPMGEQRGEIVQFIKQHVRES